MAATFDLDYALATLRAMQVARWIIYLAVIAAAASGIGRLRVDTDILALLPDSLAEVRGLRTLQEEFSREGELVVLLECREEDAGLLEDAAEELAAMLEEAGAAQSARWRPTWSEEPEELAELVAYLWINGEPEALKGLAERLSPEQIEQTLETALLRVATAIEGADLAMRAHDPFGLLEQSALRELIERRGGSEGFGAVDGQAHLILVEAQREARGYKEAGAWIQEVRDVCTDWRSKGNDGVSFRFTGDPAFNAEIGAAIERDMSGTVMVTSILIGALFLCVHRRLELLAGLGAMLGLVFIITLGVAGWVQGSLGIVSVAFAAILIGLTVDYGVLICQEAKLEHHDVFAVRRAVRRSVTWAAATTAAVFAALNGSSLPGIGQLGSLVAVGIVVGAVVMLGFYVPLVARAGAGLSVNSDRGAPFPKRSRVGVIALVAGALSVVALVRQGTPGIEFDFSLMRPRNSPAMDAFERVRAAYPAWREGSLKLVVESRESEELLARMVQLEEGLTKLKEDGVVEDWWLPEGWWPNHNHQLANRSGREALARDAARLIAAADEAGFNERGVALGKAVFEEFARSAQSGGSEFPKSAGALELMSTFLARNEGRGVLLGEVVPVEGALDEGALRELQGDGVSLAGWEALRPAVLPLIRRDLWRVFLPMALVMVVMLMIVFRRASDVIWVLLGMAFSVLVLCGVMAAIGMRWNFLNVAAIPLLLGTGVDYGIHMLLAMRRADGDLRRAWHGTGKAILFCGFSTAIGFGSLSLASNVAMASMGIVCAIGILLNMATAVFLLPGLVVAGAKPVSGRSASK